MGGSTVVWWRTEKGLNPSILTVQQGGHKLTPCLKLKFLHYQMKITVHVPSYNTNNMYRAQCVAYGSYRLYKNK